MPPGCAGVTLVSISTACASSLPNAAAAGSQAGPPEVMAPYHARFHREPPVVAVIAENGGTALVDFVVPYGVLARSGVAEVVAVATHEGVVTMRPALQIELQATTAQFDARFPEGADDVIVPFMVQRKDPVLLSWSRAQADEVSIMVSICGRRSNAGRYLGRDRLESRA
jgi:putative intracellular protease/amidase